MTNDLAARFAFAKLVQAGGKTAQPIGPLQMASGQTRFALYADPEGNLLEVIER